MGGGSDEELGDTASHGAVQVLSFTEDFMWNSLTPE